MASGEVTLPPSDGHCGYLVGWAPVPGSATISSRYKLVQSHATPV